MRCCIVLLILLGACSRQPAQQSAQKQQVAVAPSSTLLYGGDTHAWLGPLGNMQDQSYCHANLKLPLSGKAAWQYEYTSAEFSGLWPAAILNYNGTLVVSAVSPQLMLIDQRTGNVITNKDVYQRNDAFNGQQEAFNSTYLSPAGRLVTVDASNNFYGFDIASLARLWFLPTPRGGQLSSALVTDAQHVYANWGGAGNWNLHSIGVETGKPGWVYGLGADPNNLGLTLSRSGILLAYARPNQLRAVKAADGMPMWTVYASAEVTIAPIDELRQRVYALLDDESLDCRDLHTGQLLWIYSWTSLLGDSERESRMQRSGLREVTPLPLDVLCTAVCVGSDGVYLSTQIGDVLHLSTEGRLLWKVRLDAPVVSMLLFDNALLASQQYQIPDVLEKNRDMPQSSSQDAFNLVKPNWSNLTPSKDVRHARFSRFAALSRSNGAMLSSVDTAVTSLSNLCPAGGTVVFGGSLRGKGALDKVHYITAYSWVEQ